jgi:hypothetical protein
MFHDQLINFPEATVVLRPLTDAISALGAALAMRPVRNLAHAKDEPTLVERRLALIPARDA